MLVEESDAIVHIPPLPTIAGDATQFTQLWQNLVGNALKFRGEEAPQVWIEAQRDGAMWRFIVRDNGIGIDPKYAARIFVIFQRLHTRSKYAGTGIGLAICKKIVERHGGQIWMDTPPQSGTSFVFTIPIA